MKLGQTLQGGTDDTQLGVVQKGDGCIDSVPLKDEGGTGCGIGRLGAWQGG